MGESGLAPVRAAMTALSGAVDALQHVDWSRCDDASVLAAVRAVEVQRRRLSSVDHTLVSEQELRSVAAKHLFRGTPQVLSGLLQVDLNEARATVRAVAVGDSRDPRSGGQRRHDALLALCTQLLSSGALPDNRGLPATVVLTMTLDQLEAAMASPPECWSPGTDQVAEPIWCGRLAKRAHLAPAVFNRGDQPL